MNQYLVYFPLDLRKFHRWTSNRELIRKGVFDRGYAFHVFLSSTFGKSMLQPFRIFAPTQGRTASIYAYSTKDKSSLKEIADLVATPDCLEVLNFEDILSKPMRFEFPSGQEIGFDVRIRPVRRLIRDLYDSKSQKTFSKGSEMDVFSVNAIRRYPEGWIEKESVARKQGESRSKVYIDWLIERMGNSVTIDLENCSLRSYERTRLWRGDKVGFEGPDAVIQGNLIVNRVEEFATQVRDGIGRHRAYGYGMLLLRPPTHRA